MKIFLGGTCNGSQWREELKPMLTKMGIEFFDPVVPDWTEACYQEELKQREECDFCLYTITPKMLGVYSIAEVVDDSNKRPEKTLFCLVSNSEHEGARTLVFGSDQYRSLDKVGVMVKANGGEYFKSLHEVAAYLRLEMECEEVFSEHNK